MTDPAHVFDGHNDAVTRYTSDDDDWTFLERSERGHLDYPRGVEGGFIGGFFAIFPGIEPQTWFPRGEHYHRDSAGFRVDLAPPLDEKVAYEASRKMFDRLDATEQVSQGRFAIIRSRAQLDAAIEASTMAAVAHFEGAEALGSQLQWFDEWYERGLRSVGPVWSRPNAFATGVPFAYPATPDIGPGLTDAGRELVRECDRRGVVIDLAHINEAGFWDVARLTTRPLVVTHTAAHALCTKPRNLLDTQIDAVGESKGVIGVTFFTNDLTASLEHEGDVPVSRIVDHIRYLVDRIGTTHVALGSDFDGARMPRELGDAAGLPRLIEALEAAGFHGDELAAITHGNWLRVLRSTLH